jgi:hypothetical protein
MWTKYVYTEKPGSAQSAKTMHHNRIIILLNSMTLQGPGSQLYHHKVKPYMEEPSLVLIRLVITGLVSPAVGWPCPIPGHPRSPKRTEQGR